jgi:hypothetical protein
VRQTLANLGVDFLERDISMAVAYKEELKKRLGMEEGKPAPVGATQADAHGSSFFYAHLLFAGAKRARRSNRGVDLARLPPVVGQWSEVASHSWHVRVRGRASCRCRPTPLIRRQIAQ